MFLALLTTKVLAITTFGKVTAKKVFGNIGTQFCKYWHTILEILAHNFGNIGTQFRKYWHTILEILAHNFGNIGTQFWK